MTGKPTADPGWLRILAGYPEGEAPLFQLAGRELRALEGLADAGLAWLCYMGRKRGSGRLIRAQLTPAGRHAAAREESLT